MSDMGIFTNRALLPTRDDGEKYKHEHYSAAIVRTKLRALSRNMRLVTTLALKRMTWLRFSKVAQGRSKLCSGVISLMAEMDADRMDYLLRDSYHAGVQYGRFDLRRVISTMKAVPDPEGGAPRLGISEGGFHSAEALVLARYFMFTQVYFHKTRVACDVHLREHSKSCCRVVFFQSQRMLILINT